MKRILHPSDFSRASRSAFKKAIELARATRASLDLLHVMTPVAPILGDGYSSSWDPRPHRLLAVPARERGLPRGGDLTVSGADRARQVERWRA